MEQRSCTLEDEGTVTTPTRSGGNLTTARCALQALALLENRPEGVRAEEVATTVGKSISTAYYLLRALCEEGFAVHDPHRGVYRAMLHGDDRNHESDVADRPGDTRRELSLAALADELFSRTRKRSYVGVLRRGAVEIVEVRGRQGLPRQPGLGDRISDAAHATGMGKVVLSLMRPVAVDRYIDRGLRRFTPVTNLDGAQLRRELKEARGRGYATEVEELAPDFCCIAAPVFDADGGLRAIVGISMSLRSFEDSAEVLSRAVMQVAATKLVAPRRTPATVPAPALLEKTTVS